MGKSYFTMLTLQEMGLGKEDWDLISDDLGKELIRFNAQLALKFDKYNRIRPRYKIFEGKKTNPERYILWELKYG